MMERPDNTPRSRARQDDLMRDPELFNRMLDNQATELEIRSDEIALREREREAAHDYAIKSLELQAEDRREERIFHRGLSSKVFTFLIFVLLIVVAGFCYALYLNKDQVVMEIVKAVVYLGAGGIGGYSAKSLKAAKEEELDE